MYTKKVLASVAFGTSIRGPGGAETQDYITKSRITCPLIAIFGNVVWFEHHSNGLLLCEYVYQITGCSISTWQDGYISNPGVLHRARYHGYSDDDRSFSNLYRTGRK